MLGLPHERLILATGVGTSPPLACSFTARARRRLVGRGCREVGATSFRQPITCPACEILLIVPWRPRYDWHRGLGVHETAFHPTQPAAGGPPGWPAPLHHTDRCQHVGGSIWSLMNTPTHPCPLRITTPLQDSGLTNLFGLSNRSRGFASPPPRLPPFTIAISHPSSCMEVTLEVDATGRKKGARLHPAHPAIPEQLPAKVKVGGKSGFARIAALKVSLIFCGAPRRLWRTGGCQIPGQHARCSRIAAGVPPPIRCCPSG